MFKVLFGLMFTAFGLYGLIKGQVPIAGKRRIGGAAGRLLGLALLVVGAILLFAF